MFVQLGRVVGLAMVSGLMWIACVAAISLSPTSLVGAPIEIWRRKHCKVRFGAAEGVEIWWNWTMNQHLQEAALMLH
jgi:hypothetical protein